MVYITYQAPERWRQLTFEEMMSGNLFPLESLHMGGKGATRTVVVNRVPERIMSITHVEDMITSLRLFNTTYKSLIETYPRSSLYEHFEIPKKTGGLRPIDAPCQELKKALSTLKDMMSSWMFADHHTCAFAYVNDRSVYEVAKKHQQFKAWWFASFDFSKFFPSTTLEFVLSQFRLIYPFNLIMSTAAGKKELTTALELCFLNGGLPQGTPISPFITNVMMIPFDHKLARLLNKFDNGKKNPNGGVITDRLCYTRYADDIDVSCKVIFNYKKVEREIVRLLKEMNAPFTLNETKTKFNSRAGRNWILGVMLNKDNNITVGYRKNKIFKAMLETYVRDRSMGKKWSYGDVQKLRGQISWYMSVEKDTVNYILQRYNQKFGVNILDLIAEDLRPKK